MNSVNSIGNGVPYASIHGQRAVIAAKVLLVASVVSSIALATFIIYGFAGATVIASMMGARSVMDVVPFAIIGGAATLGAASGVLQVLGHHMFEDTGRNLRDCVNYVIDSYSTTFRRATIPLGAGVIFLFYTRLVDR